MSKTLTKILTLCGLFVVVVAAVVASAVCATAAIGYKVSVDVIKVMNEDFNSPNGKIKIKINGKETNELLVKKGKEATITFETTDFEFQGYYNGGEGTYEPEDIILDENEVPVTTYKFVVNEATQLSAEFKAAQFYKFTVTSETNTTAITDGREIEVYAKENNCYPDNENEGVYWAKPNATVELDHSEKGFKFKNWSKGEVKVEGSTVSINENNITYTAHFDQLTKCYIEITAAPDGVVYAYGGTISAKLDTGEDKITAFAGTKINLTTSATGYDFVNWTANGTEIGTTKDLEYKIVDNAEIKANYTAIRYDISYDDKAAESTIWGSALKTVETKYALGTGWKVFKGWKYNGDTVTQAKFDGEDRDIALVGDYFTQSDVTYLFKTGDNVITYKTKADNRLDKTLAPSKDYYNLTGITFTIGQTNFEFTISGNDLVPVEGGKTLEELDRALYDNELTEVAVTPVYELAFDVNFTVKSNNAFGATDSTITFSDGNKKDDIANIKVLKYLAGENANAKLDSVEAIEVAWNKDGVKNVYTFGSAVDLEEVTFERVLKVLKVGADNRAAVNIEISIEL